MHVRFFRFPGRTKQMKALRLCAFICVSMGTKFGQHKRKSLPLESVAGEIDVNQRGSNCAQLQAGEPTRQQLD